MAQFNLVCVADVSEIISFSVLKVHVSSEQFAFFTYFVEDLVVIYSRLSFSPS
jgi:nicotinamide riboside transporter PnuC